MARRRATENGRLFKILHACIRGISFAPQFSPDVCEAHADLAATADDQMSARMGESYYAFLWRYFRGMVILSKRGGTGVSKGRHQPALWGLIQTSCLFGLYVLLLTNLSGASLLIFVAAQTTIIAWQLSAYDYVERYGLLRKYDAIGNLEPFTDKHFWRSHSVVNNSLLNTRVTRLPGCLGPEMRTDDEPAAYALDYGFNLLSMVVLNPRLWFRLVNPRLAERVGYDLAKVNLSGKAYVELMEAYHRAD